jgi:hypothetical protein
VLGKADLGRVDDHRCNRPFCSANLQIFREISPQELLQGIHMTRKNFQGAPCEEDEARKTDFAGATASETHEV